MGSVVFGFHDFLHNFTTEGVGIWIAELRVISDSDLPEPHGLLPKCHLLSPRSRKAASIKTLYYNPAGLEQNPAACDMWHLAQAHAALTRQDLTESFALRIMNAAAL